FLDLECLDALETFDISNLKMVKNLIFGNLPENFNLVYPELTVFYSPEGRSATSFCCSESTFNRESTKTFLDRYYTKGTGVEKLGFSISMSCNKNDGYNWRKALKKKS
ncbi:putative exported domain protein, partial [Bacteroides fragilis str. 3998T(B)3]